jgi:hypothetical protein
MHVVPLHVKLRVFMVVKIHTVVFRVDKVYTDGSEEHSITFQNIGTLIPDPNGAWDWKWQNDNHPTASTAGQHTTIPNLTSDITQS